MARCFIKLFGSMQVTLDGSPLQGLESAKVRALLAYLVMESAQAHEREYLAGLFWSEMSEAQARHGLSQSLYNLRQVLGEASKTGDLSGKPASHAPFILVTSHTVQFNPQSDYALDVQEFERCVTGVRQHAHVRRETCTPCARLLRQAEQHYQGEFLAGSSLRGCQAFEEWTLVWRERLHSLVCGVLSDLAAYYEARAELRLALELSERWTLVDPLSEPAQRGLMRLLALDGQRTQALAHYTGFRKQLGAELGVEPARETRLLYERILAEETTQTSLPGMPGRLPVPLTPFIGRENELAELTFWLRDPEIRLITLLGPGGSGKTRLALQAARTLRYNFPDGIFLVSLSGLSSSEAFLPALASTLSLVFQPNWGDPIEQLLGYLQHRHLLLILDSFEEVPSASPWVTRLLQAGSGIQILATSRARLNIQAEQVFPLEGLQYPAPNNLAPDALNLEDYSALQLFISTARQVRPNYATPPEDLPHLARISQLVDGMPLGLVLAAGWLATLSPKEIAQEIESSLDFLSASWSDLPARQRSLRATLDHSWNMLSDHERQAFQKLSVFQGAFNRQAASQVAEVDAVGLRAFVDKSMLQASPSSYRMHDLLRQYASEKLAVDEISNRQVRDAHSAYYLERMAERTSRLKSAQRSATLGEMDAEINDLQAAWKWACAQGLISQLARSLEGMCLYYEMRVRFKEGEQACQLALSVTPAVIGDEAEVAMLRASLLLWQANFLVLLGERETANQLRQQANRLLDQLETRGVEMHHPRAMYWQAEGEAQKDLKVKLDCYTRASALFQEAGDPWRQADTLIWAGEYAMRMGEATLAVQFQQEALQLARQIGEPNTLLHSLRQITYLHFVLNQVEPTRQLIQETVAVLENVAEVPLRAVAEMNLGGTLVWTGRFPEAIKTFERTLPILRSLGYRNGVSFGSMGLGVACLLNGEYARVEGFLQNIILETEQWGFPREVAINLSTLGLAVLAQGRTAQALRYLQESVGRYRQMQFAGELGWALGGLALAQEADGQTKNACDTLVEALRIAAKTHSMFAMVYSLSAIVIILSRKGKQESAMLVHRIALHQGLQQNSRWYADLVGDEMNRLWEALPAEQRAEIEASASQHTPFSIIPEVLALLEEENT